ncbi:MAG: hypothetical protein BRD45_04005, partial [Bacteroidetes bacterium QS_8_64_10]
EAACERYPWLDAVREARAARSSEAYTEHDGLLDAGPFPELDFTADGYDGLPLSPSRLETFAETPYLYFLQYVLGVRPLDEPALDDVAWLDPLRRGDILHATFDRFMKERDGGPVRLDEEAALLDALHEAFDAAKRRLAPPNDRVEATALRRLKADARVFLRTEAQRGATPWGHECGFGYGPRREREGDLDEAEIAFDDDLAVRLRGRIDRIDEGEAGGLAVWDSMGALRLRAGNAYRPASGHLRLLLYQHEGDGHAPECRARSVSRGGGQDHHAPRRTGASGLLPDESESEKAERLEISGL